MRIFQEIKDVCSRYFGGATNGNKSVALGTVLKDSLKEGYAHLGAHLPPNFFDQLSPECQFHLTFIFSKRFLKAATFLEEDGTLDRDSCSKAQLKALIVSAMQFMSEQAEGKPCTEADINLLNAIPD